MHRMKVFRADFPKHLIPYSVSITPIYLIGSCKIIFWNRIQDSS